MFAGKQSVCSDSDPEYSTTRRAQRTPQQSTPTTGHEVDRRLREFCTARTALDVETTLNKAQIGCSRVFGVEDSTATSTTAPTK